MKNMIIGILCGVIGVILIRYVILNPMEIMGWNMFWSSLLEHPDRITKMDWAIILKATSFWKSVGGFAVFGIGGYIGSKFIP